MIFTILFKPGGRHPILSASSLTWHPILAILAMKCQNRLEVI
jgi:hypothetical protein